MNEPAATLEVREVTNRNKPERGPAPPPGAAIMKFSYASGARPLDGYTIKRGVGVGGFGEVYFATSDAGKEVALKRVQRNLDIEVRGVTQCLNLKHPNLIALYDIKYDDQGEGWIVMEYVSGESLKDVLDASPDGLTLDEVNRWFQGIASGVEYLHDHGIVHRDLKPGNIFIDEDIVKIGDYGLSKFISCSRRSGQTESVGTFHYMAPEIGKGVYGKEIDVYALGIMLCEMISGTVPFNGESSQEIIMKHLTAEPQLDGIPQPYRRVIERALYKDPGQRFSCVGEMVAALQLKTEKVSVGSKSTRMPPVVIDRPEPTPEPIYISDETADEIVFGPLVEVVSRAESAKPPVVGRAAAGGTQHEPIARAVRRSWVGAVGWWNTARLSSPVKVLLLVIGIFVLLLNASWLVPLAVVLGAAYLIYFGLRSLSLARQDRGTSPAASPPGDRMAGRGRRRKSMVPVSRWQTGARRALRQKTVSDRLGETTGSMLMSSLVAAVLCIVLMAMSGQSLDGSVHFWSFFSWLLLTTLVGSWALLTLGKFWERDEGDSMQRRFVLLMTGLAVGAAAFALGQVLMIRPQEHQLVSISDLPTGHIPAGMYAADGTPQLAAYLIFFAGLFVVLRWWKLCDPLRRTRLSIWATVVTVVWALIMHVLWQFPQPWGFMIAAATAVTVQLSSSWMTTPQRARVRRELLEA